MIDAEVRDLLKNFVEWGAWEFSDFREEYGDGMYMRLKRKGLIETTDTPYGKLMYLTRPGRLEAGLTNLYYPTIQALVNNIALRKSVKSLLEEAYSDPKPRFYGKYHAQMKDPGGNFVCVTARATGFSSSTLRLMAVKLFDGTPHPGLTKLIAFVPKIKRLQNLTERYPIELRKVELGSYLQTRVGRKPLVLSEEDIE
jgi:hypothetical protein